MTQRRLCIVALTMFALASNSALAQKKLPEPSPGQINGRVALTSLDPQASTPSPKRLLTISDAVAIFMQQNLQLVAARYDIDTAEAEKLTARLRPNPQVTVALSGAPLNLSGNIGNEQTYDYTLSQTFETAGKRGKRIEVAGKNADLARGQFETAVWQMTNELKRKFYTVILNKSLLSLAQDNEKTFAETVKHTEELVQAGELAGLDLTRLQVEKLKFDTDLANAERDYEVALRDLRVTLGGDYRAMEIEPAGSLDPQVYDFTFADLRDKALAARPDLKAAQMAE